MIPFLIKIKKNLYCGGVIERIDHESILLIADGYKEALQEFEKRYKNNPNQVYEIKSIRRLYVNDVIF